MTNFFLTTAARRRGLGQCLAVLGGLLTAAPFAAQAQTGNVGIGTTTPDASAALEVSSTSKGLLPPRLSQAQRDAIASPAVGLTIFNTSMGLLNTWDGTKWVAALTNTSLPDVSFAYTGGPQTYTVPAGITTLTVDLAGAAGGPVYGSSTGQGAGGRVQATLAVTPGQVLTIYVGGAGAASAAGYNGGGGALGGPGGGGGASDLRTGGATLAERVLVAGGGGGGGYSGVGGAGGGLTGGTGGTSGGRGGLGGSQSAAGAGGAGNPTGPGGPGNYGSGATGGGGSGTSGGGGGGYYGGGSGGSRAGGGGGSSYAGAGTGAVAHTQGYQGGNGYVNITAGGAPANPPAPYLDGSNITGVVKNQTTPQAGANFNIDGNGTIGGNSTVTGNSTVGGNSTVDGNVGIGTSTPTQKLSVVGSAILSGTVEVDANNANDGTFTGGSPLKGLIFGAPGTGEGIGSNRTGTVNGVGVDIYTQFTPRLSVAQAGNVGIGTSAPTASAALDISSTKQGLLVPRMRSAQRTGINSPATGLMVFDTDSTSLYLYGGAAEGWNKLATLNGRGPVVRGTPQRNIMVWSGTQWRAGSPCEVLGPYLSSFPDLPDDNNTDTNCDGVDGDASKAVFVAMTGLDTNPGTRGAPLRTPAAAVLLAVAQGKTQVLVAAGSYSGMLPLRNGVSVYGGYSAANWTRNPANVVVISNGTLLNGAVDAATGSSLSSSTILENLTLQALSTSAAGVSVYGVRCLDCPRLEVRHCTISAGSGGPGGAGSAGGGGSGGSPGGNGGDGSCDASAGGGSGKSYDGGEFGGSGGYKLASCIGCTNNSTGNGFPAGNGGPGSAAGGAAGNPGQRGSDGGNGPNGGNGTAGTGGSGGTAATAAWVSAKGQAGTGGANGYGGGGGGGGGGQTCAVCLDGTGNGGGAGGGTGKGSGGGDGGTGGGGSFGVLLVNSTGAVLLDNTIAAANGGAGGQGGAGGGPGGTGGAGGLGGTFCTSEVGAGGNGGKGGNGGAGAAGGGGAGGPSYGVYRLNSTVSTAGNTISFGSGGAGGAGGAGAGAGTAGAAAQVQ